VSQDTREVQHICISFFLFINHSGRGDIKTHLNSYKHKRAISAAAFSSLLTTFFRPEKIGNKDEPLAATEGAFTPLTSTKTMFLSQLHVS
jgi:hypothetical protein